MSVYMWAPHVNGMAHMCAGGGDRMGGSGREHWDGGGMQGSLVVVENAGRKGRKRVKKERSSH